MATMASHGRNGMDRGRVGVVLFFWGQACTPTLKTARAVIFTLNLKPLKPPIQLPKGIFFLSEKVKNSSNNLSIDWQYLDVQEVFSV